MTIPAPIAHTVQQTQEWLKELRDNAGLEDEATALSVMRIVLHQVRDRLSAEEAVDLAAQLPIIVRGLYFEGWRPGQSPQKVHTKQKFLDQVTLQLLPRQIPPEPAVRAVLAVLAHHCDPGEIGDVIGQMPSELKELWPAGAVASARRPSQH